MYKKNNYIDRSVYTLVVLLREKVLNFEILILLYSENNVIKIFNGR